MTVAVAVDFGTSSTCVAVAEDEHQGRVVVIDGSPLMPSAVYADGRTLFVGAEAQRQAAVDPARYEPMPKRRIDEGSLLLGDAVVPVQRAIAAVLSRAVREARDTVGGRPVDVLVLTHPADWGAVRAALLVSAAHGLAASVRTVAEPVAAALQHGTGSADGAVVAVLDVGAGTADVSVLRRDNGEFRVLATRGDPRFGGADIDEALLQELGERLSADWQPFWNAVTRGPGMERRRRRRMLRADICGAKESLSRHPYADVPLPGQLPDAHVTRANLERLIAEPVASVVDMLAATLRDAGAMDADGACHAGVFLVGGSSRIPLFSNRIHQRLGVLAVSPDQPETVVARGALRVLPQAAPTQEPPAQEPAGVSFAPAHPPTAAATRVDTRWVRYRRRWWGVAAVVVIGVGVGAAVLSPRDAAPPAARTVIVARTSFAVPASWQENHRVEGSTSTQVDLTPDGIPAGDQGLFVVQTVLD
ncbi:MAG: Hsp70 family protein, partial [Mycobacteriaceae bacterium]